mgnify:CR=1 FL=1
MNMNSLEAEEYARLLETPHGVTITTNDVMYSMSSIKIKKLNPEAVMPTKADPLDAGYDLYAAEDAMIEPHHRKTIKTGIAMAIPANHVGLVWPRSGLAVKNGIDVLAGVVDSGYRGEICAVLQNHGIHTMRIKAGDRVAQILFQKIESFQLQESETLDDSSRGDGGFGSTGV